MINIYVANLAPSTTEEEIKALFEGFGEVTSAKIIKDRYTGESRGFAFVEMPDKSQGEEAINGTNGQELNNRALKVNEARPKPDNNRRGSGGGGRGGFGGGGGGRGGFGGNRDGGGRY